MSFLKQVVTFSGFTLISRMLGFLRDMLIAYKLGVTPLADVFFVSFRLPNIFRSLFAEGAFSSAFVPIYAKNQDKNFLNDMFAVLLTTLIVFCVFMQLAMPIVIYFLAPGFTHDPSKFADAVFLSRFMFPYLIFMSLVALLGAALQTEKRFAAIAAAPIILNICMIFGLVYLTEYIHVLYALSFGVVLAGMLQLLLLLSALARAGHVVKLGNFAVSDNMRLFFHRLIPAVFSAGIIQISTIVDTFFASSIPSGVSYIYYADRVMQLPLALIGISLGNVLLPTLAKYASEADVKNMINTQNKAIQLAFILCIPASAAMYILPNTVITCLFAYGEFSYYAAEQTANALKAFATALPAFVLYKIIINNYFARGDTKTPALVSLLCLFINIILNIILVRYYQHVGIVIASSISNWINVSILIIKLRLSGHLKFKANINLLFMKILFATGLMLFVIQMVDVILQPLILGPITLKLFVISTIAAIGMGVYFGSLFLINKISS